jgi:hydroxyacylglutathione hydrolase
MRVETVATDSLGDRSYVIHDGTLAVVVDPQRDIDRVTAVLHQHGLTLAMVLETHIHNDYVTGGFALAQAANAPYLVAAQDEVEFARIAASDGDEFAIGALTVLVVATPGHTDGHLSYVVTADGSAPAVFTGGSLLFGTVGRTDLIDPDRVEELTRAQYRSARRLASALPADTTVYPTHGFGSFCSSGSPAGSDTSTIGAERVRNDALREPDEDRFVAALISGLTAYPAYYVHMGHRNRQGPAAPDLTPLPSVDRNELAKRLADGEWVVDLRSRAAFAADHLTGTISIELGKQFATYLGWLFPYGLALTLIGETGSQLAEAQRELVRIGLDRPAAAGVGPLEGLSDPDQRRSFPKVGFAELRVMTGTDVLVDVRRDDERANGAIPGSLHVPLHRLLTSMSEVPDARLWVHCASGFRATIAASVLDRAGREIILVDDPYPNAIELGLAAS